MEVSGCTSYEAVFRQSVYRRIRDCAYRKTPTEQAELFCRSEAFAFAPDINDIYRDSREIWGQQRSEEQTACVVMWHHAEFDI